MKHWQLLLFLLIFTSCKTESQVQKLSIYVSGHADDWQLFMGEQAWKDIQDPQTRTVFILTTAGDAAMGMNAGDSVSMPYYKARERGYVNALMWAFDGKLELNEKGRAELPLSDYTLRNTQVGGKQVKTFSLPNLTSYLLYLPDGFPQGQHTWSLEKLYKNEITQMPTIDSTTFYESWESLRSTVSKLIKSEIVNDYEITLNLAERDTTLNAEDHSDHIFSSLLVEEAVGNLADRIIYYREYGIRELSPNLSQEDENIKRFLFSANALSKEEAGYPSPWDDHHLSWIGKSYYREVIKD